MEQPRSSDSPEKRKRLRIPDEDIRGWIETLRSMGLDEKDIDDFLIRKNITYANLKIPEIVEDMVNEIEATSKTKLSPEERIAIEKLVEEKYTAP